MVYRRWWLVAGVLGSSMGLSGLAAAQLPAVPVQTPAVSTPALPAPLPVPIPAVPTLPAVTVPVPVSTPAVSVPSVSTPSLSTPAGSVPSVSTPHVSTSSPSSAGAGSGSAPSSSGGSSGSATSGAGGATGAGTTPGGSPSPAAEASSGGAGSAHSRSSNDLSNSPAAKARRRDRALRRSVLRFQGCLSQVPRSERRVLTLRAGVGSSRAHSRTEVARITHLRRARVITLERRGLRRLHTLGRTDTCEDAQTASAAAPVATAATPPTGSAPDGRGAVPAEHQVSDSKAAGAQAHHKPTAELAISRPAIAPGTSGFDLTLVFAAFGLLAFVFVVTREVKRTD